jgi:hypothetical protein
VLRDVDSLRCSWHVNAWCLRQVLPTCMCHTHGMPHMGQVGPGFGLVSVYNQQTVGHSPVCMCFPVRLQRIQGAPQVLVQVATALLQPSLVQRSCQGIQQCCIVGATMADNNLQALEGAWQMRCQQTVN